MKKQAILTIVVCFCGITAAAGAIADTTKEKTKQADQNNFIHYLEDIDMISVPGGCF